MLPYVEIRNLSRTYRGNFTLNNVSIDLEKGEVLTLMGPSGSGKTSLLRNICGLDTPDSGKILIEGRDLTHLPVAGRNIGMIFQDLAIFPHMTVYDNIAYGLRNIRMGEDEVENRVTELSSMLGISQLLDSRPGEISGGQRQRVALARSVAPSPSLLLLDEPLSSLDVQLRTSVRSEIREFARKIGMTMIYVTHDHAEGLFMADKAGIIFNGALGEIKSPSELFLHPMSENVARFFGYNIISVENEKVAFFPSDFVIDSSTPEISGKIGSIGFEGEYFRIHFSMNNGDSAQLKMHPADLPERIRIGDTLQIRLTRPEKVR